MRQAGYPLRLLGLSLSYRLPPFPVSPLGTPAAVATRLQPSARLEAPTVTMNTISQRPTK